MPISRYGLRRFPDLVLSLRRLAPNRGSIHFLSMYPSETFEEHREKHSLIVRVHFELAQELKHARGTTPISIAT